jgi:ribosomal protein S18 acetylase RimI-like enzyme
VNDVDDEVLLESILAIGESIGDLTGTDSTERRTGYAVNRSDIPIPQANGMYVHGPEEAPALADMAVLRDLFATEGRPFGVTTIDGRTLAVERAAEDLGLREVSVDVAMTLPREDFRATPPQELRIERVPATDMAIWVEVAAAGFEQPPTSFEATLSPGWLAVLDEAWLGSVIGWVDDVPVSTASFMTHEGSGVLFAVATPPEHRGKGYATAVTSDAIARGFAAGATFAWLEASPMGLGIYERLGFRAAWTSRCRAEPVVSDR